MSNKEIIIPIKPGSNVVIDWGDGSPLERYTGDGSEGYLDNLDTLGESFDAVDAIVGDMPYHQYDVDAQYDVKLYGYITGVWLIPPNQSAPMTDVKQWGDIEIDEFGYGNVYASYSEFGGLFVSQKELTISAADAPNIKPGTLFSNLFAFTKFNSDISHWDISNVVNMASMFYGAESFSQDLSSWNATHVENYDGFAYSSAYNDMKDRWPVFETVSPFACPTPPADQWFGDADNNTPQLYSLNAWYLTNGAIVGGTAIDVSTDCVFAFAAGGVNTFQAFESDFTPDTLVVVFQPTNNEFQFGEWDSLSLTAIGGSDRWGPQLAYVNKSRSDLESESGEPLNMDHCYRVTMDNITYAQETGRRNLGSIQFGAEYAQLRLRDVEFYKAGQRIYPTTPT